MFQLLPQRSSEMSIGAGVAMAKESLENVKGMMEKTRDKWDEVKRIVRADQKGWLVCLAVLIVTIVRSGITYSFGSVVVNLQETYPNMTTLTEQSTAPSFTMLL